MKRSLGRSRASRAPASISALCSRFQHSVADVSEATSSALEIRSGGTQSTGPDARDPARETVRRPRVNRPALRVDECCWYEESPCGPIFNDLLGGGWRRTVALTSVGSLVAFLAGAEVMSSRDTRRVVELDTRQARGFDPMPASGYRDHAATGSMFIGTLASSWAELDPAARRAHAPLPTPHARAALPPTRRLGSRTSP